MWWTVTRVAARCLTSPASWLLRATARLSAFQPSTPPISCTGAVLVIMHHPPHLSGSACNGHTNSFGRYRDELLLRHVLHLAVQAALPRLFAPALCFSFVHGFRIIGRIGDAGSTALPSSNAAATPPFSSRSPHWHSPPSAATSVRVCQCSQCPCYTLTRDVQAPPCPHCRCPATSSFLSSSIYPGALADAALLHCMLRCIHARKVRLDRSASLNQRLHNRNSVMYCSSYREREALLLLRALELEIDCFPLGLSLRQLNWNQQQQQHARAAGVSLVASHASRDILKSPSEPIVLLQTFVHNAATVAATAAAAVPSTLICSHHDDFEYVVFHPSSRPWFPFAPALDPSLLQHVRCISLAHQPPGALAAAVACAHQGTRLVVQGCYRGGFTIRTPGVSLTGEGTAVVDGDGNKNAVCISARDCAVTGLVIKHAQHHCLHVTGGSCCIVLCRISDAARAAVGVFGSGSVVLQGCWLGQRCASGVYTTDRGHVMLSDCAVTLCTGAGVHCSGSSVVAADGVCVALTRKAGLFCEKSSCVRLSDCTFLRNAFGGVHVVDSARANMMDCRQSPPPPNHQSGRVGLIPTTLPPPPPIQLNAADDV